MKTDIDMILARESQDNNKQRGKEKGEKACTYYLSSYQRPVPQSYP